MESQRLTFCSSHYDLTELDDWFNLTATFKYDSSLYLDYKEFRSWTDIELNQDYLNAYKNLFRNNIDPLKNIFDLSHKIGNLETSGSTNTARAVVIISHCETYSRREIFARFLLMNY